MTTEQTDLFTFENTALPLLEEHRADWLERARQCARDYAVWAGEATVDDVRERCPPPKDVDPRVMGAVFKTKEWECVRYVRSTRNECHKRPIGVFRLAGR